jgi:molybdopterin-guanine dinucleotide biosynthesis protein
MSRTLVITVSGSRAGVGKTRLIEMLIPFLKDCAAIKAVTHEATKLSVIVEDDSNTSEGKDTGRFLSAGARRAYLITGAPAEVRGAVDEVIAEGGFDAVVVESNEMTKALGSDLSLFVKGEGDVKPNADACEELADAIVSVPSARAKESRCRMKRKPG